MTRGRRVLLLGVLTLGHFLADMFGGFLLPLLPSLAQRLNATEAAMGLVAAVAGVVVNSAQPLAGAVMHRIRGPLFLWLGPLLAIGYALLGEVRSVSQLLLLVAVASVGVGIFHPGALLGAHVVSGGRDRVGIPLFLSGGAFGVAAGAVLSTQWVGRLGFEQLWWLALPGLAAVLLLLLPSGVLRLDIHQPLPERARQAGVHLPFTVLLLLGSLLAMHVSLLVTYYPMHLQYVLGDDALTWGGYTLSIISLGGALTSYLWGALSRRINILRMLALGQFAAAGALLLLFSASGTTAIFYGSVLAGICAGGAFFPLIATLARHAIGLTPGLRAGLIIGGSWGIGALGVAAAAVLLKFNATPTQVGLLTVPLSLLTGIIALLVAYAPRAARQAVPRQPASH